MKKEKRIAKKGDMIIITKSNDNVPLDMKSNPYPIGSIWKVKSVEFNKWCPKGIVMCENNIRGIGTDDEYEVIKA